jgi:nicotinamidase-related amidase
MPKNGEALLVLDMLNDFMRSDGALYCGDACRKIIPVIRSLIDRFAERDYPVIYVCDAHRQDDREFEMFAPHAVKDSWGARIIEELSPPPGSRIVAKTRFSPFFRTNLEEILDSLKPSEVWVTGVVTSICVMDTVADLRNRDYRTVVPVDAVADFDEGFHAFALKRMERVYGAQLLRGEN